ncbi:type II secretion system F family protein [Planctomycetales bacterium ZRK34]|nr:type II secretion system F family protein [Planctomycetales bacterium ZRK34]
MAVYSYKAIEAGRAAVSGTVTADTPRQARDLLRSRGLTIQDVRRQRAANLLGGMPKLFTRRHTNEVVTFVRELSTLLSVGIPMLQSIDTIAKQHRGPFCAVLMIIRDRVASGVSLAEAMREHPIVFDTLCISIIEVGENAGTLETALQQLAEFKERSARLKNRVASALVYPCVVLSAGVLVSIFLMTFVVPNLLATLQETGKPLPMATRVVQAASDALVGWWWLIGLIVVGCVIAFSAVARTTRGRVMIDRAMLRVPILGQMIRKQSISRIAMVVSTLIQSGVAFVRALQIAQNTTPNHVMRQALIACEQAVYAGSDIAEALDETGVFPPMVIQVFAAGQQSGRLEEMLTRLAEDYDQQVATAANRLTVVLEPVLILILAVMVGFIAFATFMPILEAGNVL